MNYLINLTFLQWFDYLNKQKEIRERAKINVKYISK